MDVKMAFRNRDLEEYVECYVLEILKVFKQTCIAKSTMEYEFTIWDEFI